MYLTEFTVFTFCLCLFVIDSGFSCVHILSIIFFFTTKQDKKTRLHRPWRKDAERCPAINPAKYLSIYLSRYINLFYPSIYPFTSLSIPCTPTCPPIHLLSIILSIYPFISPSISPHISPCVCVCVPACVCIPWRKDAGRHPA